MVRLTEILIWEDCDVCDEIFTIREQQVKGSTFIVCGLGTDRNGLLAAGPDLAGYHFTIRLAGFCRTKTGVWRVKYKAAGTCRKI